MFQRLTVRGLGPHKAATIELAPSGVVEIAGASEVGKSTLVEAVCFALWGCGSDGKRFRVEGIRDGMARGEVILESAGGGVIRRALERAGRKVTRSLQRQGEGKAQRFGTEAAFARALGPLGLRGDQARLVVVPLGWTGLATGHGRGMRDALLGCLPEVPMAGVVARRMAAAGFVVGEEAGCTDKQAMKARREARRERDEARGRLSVLEVAAERDPAAIERAVLALEAGLAAAVAARAEVTGAEGVCPTCARPGWVDTAGARAAADGAVEAQERRLARAQLDLAEAEAAIQVTGGEMEEARRVFAEATRRAAMLDALVGAIRAAPTDALEARLGELGDLGPVSLAVTGEGVSVLVDGRPWWLASRGRLVVADLWLRAGLRRALEMPWLPIFVDNIQDVGGQRLPEVAGPLILLRTNDGPLTVLAR